MRSRVPGMLVVVFACAVGSGPAAADALVRACFDNQTGDLRVVDGGRGECDPRKETVITWSYQGPAGAPGPQGIQGPPGPSKAIAFAFDPPGEYVEAQETEPGQWTRNLFIMIVPPGEHVVNGKFDLWAANTQCQLRLGNVGGAGPVLDSSRTFDYATVALAGSIKNESGFPWALMLTCQSTATTFYIGHVRFNLVTVGEVAQVSVPTF
jgi:hypothetical protein